MQSQEHEAAGPVVSSQEGERDASWSSLSPSCFLVLWTVGWCHPHPGDDSPISVKSLGVASQML